MKIQYHLLVSNHKEEDAFYTSPQGHKIPMYKEWEEWVTMDDSEFDDYCNNHPNLNYVVRVLDKNEVNR